MAPKRHNQQGGSPNPARGNIASSSSTITSSTASASSSSSSSSTNNNNNLPPNLPTSKVASSLQPSSARKSSSLPAAPLQDVLAGIWKRYVSGTPQRVKLLDTFMAFLVLLGALQFVYCVIVGNYPFNAFLSGFSATVGQFVLTASLRIQTNPENKTEFKSVSHERAFADFVFGSLILHFFCVNFIN